MKEKKATGKLRKSLSLFLVFFKISSLTFGGGAAMIPLVIDQATKRKKWMTEPEMLDCIAISQSIPGAMIGNIASYTGRKVAGSLGALAACIGTALPAFVAILIVMMFWEKISDLDQVQGFVKGVISAAAGLIAVSVFQLGKAAITNIFEGLIAVAAFVLVAFLNISVVWVILGGAVIGFPVYIFVIRQKKRGLK